ncbi:MAG: hypothetical protein ACE5JX_18295 [Acidobacteriota bacterium]
MTQVKPFASFLFLFCLFWSDAGAQTPTLVFPQLANGGGIQSEIILTNPGSLQDTGTIFLRESDGDPFPLIIDGKEQSSIPYSIPPGGLLRLKSDGSGPAKAGYATVFSDNGLSELVGGITYNLVGFEVSVPSSRLGVDFQVFVEKNASANSGIALANTGNTQIAVLLRLLDRNGNLVDSTTLTPAGREQCPRFIDELFDEVPPSFTGSVRATSENAFGLVGIRQKTTGSMAILTASTGTSASQLVFTQLAAGGDIQSEIILLNPADKLDTGTITFRGQNGQPLVIPVDGVAQSTISYSIPAGGVVRIQTDKGGPVQVGYAQVLPDSPDSRINGNIVYNLRGFEVSVPNSPLSTQYHVFVELNASADSGIALANPGARAISISTQLLDSDGKQMAQKPIDLAAGQQMARFLNEIYDNLGPSVTATLQLESSDEFSLLGLRMRPNASLSTLSSSTTALRPPSPTSSDLSDYWMAVDLAEVSSEEKAAFCAMSAQEMQNFRDQETAQARKISDDLESYIRSWLRGEVPPEIPAGLLPPSIDNEKTHSWKLLRPEEVRPEDQWFMFPARVEPSVDGFTELHSGNAATHVTYLKMLFIAPFNSELLIEGDFGHARQQSFHLLAPFDPNFPITTTMGIMEVPIMDVDIEPESGHVNPFRMGVDRNAQNRHYHVTFELKEGNAYDLNPVLQNPHFRAPGNTRVGGPLAPTGIWGGGVIVPSLLWLRYYVPDLKPDGSVDPLAGVDLPKALLRLESGETFWLRSDFSLAAQRQSATFPAQTTLPVEPTELVGPSFGWFKIFTILLVQAEARGYQVAQPFGPFPASGVKAQIRNQNACFFNQGPSQPLPGSIAHSATDQPYNNYLTRPVWLGSGKVYALSGRMPTTPPHAQWRAHHGAGPGTLLVHLP